MPSSDSASRHAAYAALVLLAAINAFNYVDRAALSLVLPLVQRDLHLSDTALGLISGLPFSVCYALCSLPAAHIADHFSRRRLMAIGFAFWSAMTALSGVATSGLQLAAARLALGAGESIGLPTTASLIADLFSGRGRAVAFAVLAASPNVGVLLGFPAVAWVMHAFGWRAAFLAAGLPGLLLAAIFYLLVREPPRRSGDGSTARAAGTSFRQSLAFLVGARSYVLILIAGGLVSINIGGFLAWAPTFLVRIHHLTPQGIGTYFGTLRGIAGLLGALLAGLIVNALAQRDEIWRVWVPAAAFLLLFPADALFLEGTAPIAWQSGLMLDAVLNSVQIATTYTLFVSVARSDMRAIAAALYFLVCTLVGLACGPAIVGTLNDVLRPQWGETAIRYSMLLTAISAAGAGGVTLVVGRHWQRDVQRAAAAEATVPAR
jgi:MFS family permease